MSIEGFLTDEQEQRIIDAIAASEDQTSGEVRIHVEQFCKKDPLERAARIFHELGMDETRLQNGVLIYIATEDHKAAVYAGKGIHKQVEDGFWSDVLTIILEHFKNEEYENGMIKGITKVGSKLKELFPYRKGDVNELSDEISYLDDEEE